MTAQPHLRVVNPGETRPPMLPPDIDLRDMPEALVNIQAVTRSRFAATASPEERCARLDLFLASFHEQPAASLPSDDAELAYLANFPRDLQGWRRVKEKALEGWTLCSDGRYYRPDVAIKALSFWIKRLASRAKADAGVAARKKKPFDAAKYERPLREARAALYALDPQSPALRGYLNEDPDIEPGEGADTATPGPTSGSTPGPTSGQTKRSEAKRSEISGQSPETARAQDGPDQEIETGEGAPPIETVDKWPSDGFPQFWRAWPGERVNRGHAEKAFKRAARECRVPFSEVLAGLERYRLGKPPDRPWRNPATWLNGRGWEDEWPNGQPPDGGPSAGGRLQRPMAGVPSAIAGIRAAMERRGSS